MQQLPLSELHRRISATLAHSFSEPLWVVAEVVTVRINTVGYTYIELVEKRNNAVVAKGTGKFWTPNTQILGKFSAGTGTPLCAGMKILFRAVVAFHVVYGLSLDIRDIDPGYSLGEMARRRREVIDRLTSEQLIDKNKHRPASLAPQRIAVISSKNAAGLDDFLYRLANNPHRYAFLPRLFPATVQGDEAEPSILRAMAQIAAQPHQFDCAVLIRGGGSAVDLSCFDGYNLARAVANFPLPLITGIGHLKDRSVCDEVSAHSASTPTAVADYLITQVRGFEDGLDTISAQVEAHVRKTVQGQTALVERLLANFMQSARREVDREQQKIQSTANRLAVSVRSLVGKDRDALMEIASCVKLRPSLLLREQTARLTDAEKLLASSARRIVESASVDLSRAADDVRHMDPANVLKRGFSITRVFGKAIRSASDVSVGMHIETVVSSGRLVSIVEGVQEAA